VFHEDADAVRFGVQSAEELFVIQLSGGVFGKAALLLINEPDVLDDVAGFGTHCDDSLACEG
jgi:hypothetical protein